MSPTRNLLCTVVVVAAALLAACSNGEPPGAVETSGLSTAPPAQPAGAPDEASSSLPQTTSYYLPASDGTRLAADVHLPAGRAPGDRHPVLLVLTRYLRSTVNPDTGAPNPALDALDTYFQDHGYAIVKVDVRGSGASFGYRPAEYGPAEVRDGYAIVEWVVNQAWSDGNVGAYGTSYTGTTAELLAAVNHPAVKAVIPGWSDFDAYTSPLRPYGLLASSFLATWGQLVGWMDTRDPQLGSQVKPVDEDVEGILLKQALTDHQKNPDVFKVGVDYPYREDDIGEGITWADLGPLRYQTAIEESGVPMLVPVSWLDAGTADGALLRFQHFSNPQKLLILGGTHGGRSHASPYTVGSEPLPPQPSEAAQFELRREIFDHYLKGVDNGAERWPPVRYFNLGEEAFHDSDVWPPAGTQDVNWHLSQGGSLTATATAVAAGVDEYTVDRDVSTGEGNRWMAQMGRPIVNLDNRGAMDERMLTYTSEPLTKDMQLAGYPVLTLHMSSSRDDGMVLAYLEDVGPDGRSRYVTEGGLRLIHRKVVPNPYFETGRPYHSFTRSDAEPMPPETLVEVSFQLWPVAALIRAGHRLRLAIAGADASVFDPLPAEGEIQLKVNSGGELGSQLLLPVVPDGLP